MTRETVIIAPELTSGGVGDYTCKLLQNLPPVPDLRLIIPKIGNRPLSFLGQYPVEETNRTTRDLLNRLPRGDGKVLVQYSAYGFDARGYPRWLINALLEWKRKSSAMLAIMFHEIWTICSIWNKNYILQHFHRRHLGQLLRLSDAVLSSTPSQAALLNALSPSCSVRVLPVGSNINRRFSDDGEREVGLAVLFGSQPTRIRTLRQMLADLKAIAAAKKIKKIVTAGAGQSRLGDDEELSLLMELQLIDGFDQCGALPEEKVSELLLTATFGISSQDELSVLKSGTLMAYAAHSLNIVSSYADASKLEPCSLMIRPEELVQGVSEVELRNRAEKLRQWQERTSSWSQIAGQVARVLEL